MRIPYAADSHSTMSPRTNGARAKRERSRIERSGSRYR